MTRRLRDGWQLLPVGIPGQNSGHDKRVRRRRQLRLIKNEAAIAGRPVLGRVFIVMMPERVRGKQQLDSDEQRSDSADQWIPARSPRRR